MKRDPDRDSSPLNGSKVSRSSMSRFEESPRERLSPERDRREGRMGTKSPSHRGSFPPRQHGGKSRGEISDRGLGRNPHDSPRELRDDFGRNRSIEKSGMYKVLCVSNISHKVNDAVVRDALMREFKKFEVTVKVIHEANDRVAYVYFRNPDDAREARHMKNRAFLFDKQLAVDPIYQDNSERRPRRSFSPESIPPGPYAGRPRGISPAFSGSSADLRRGRHSSLERGPPIPHPREPPFRREPPLPHHEFQPHPHGREEKKEKFPNYLLHIPPEEDDKATRTLFVGNLEVDIQDPDLRRIFERYGVVEDIDVKRPPPGQGNAYAFIKFMNLDMAHRAKVEMSGQYIGKFQCKIGYGKATPTTRIWVGGLGSWTSLSHLEREFDRFGAIKKIDFVKGDNHAYILYDSIDAAQAACQEMRGFPLGGPDRRLRVDFADTTPYNNFRQMSPRANFREVGMGERGYMPPRRFEHEHIPPPRNEYYVPDPEFGQWHPNSGYMNQNYDPYYERGRGPRNDWSGYNERDHRGGNGGPNDFRWTNRGERGERPPWHEEMPREWQDRRKRPRSPDGPREPLPPHLERGKELGYKIARTPRMPDVGGGDRDHTPSSRGRRSPSPYHDPAHHRDSREPNPQKPDRRPPYAGEHSESAERGRARDEFREDRGSRNGFAVASLQDVAKTYPVSWTGGLVLKNSAFPTRMHSCQGETALVKVMMQDGAGDVPMLRITQRLRLDQPKLDDVSKRIATSGPSGHCVLVGFPGAIPPPEDPNNPIQQRPLRNLVTYLKQKEAAGVIALPVSKEAAELKENVGVLYAFPPCSFSQELLKRIAPNINEDGAKEDHLVIVVVKGAI